MKILYSKILKILLYSKAYVALSLKNNKTCVSELTAPKKMAAVHLPQCLANLAQPISIVKAIYFSDIHLCSVIVLRIIGLKFFIIVLYVLRAFFWVVVC